MPSVEERRHPQEPSRRCWTSQQGFLPFPHDHTPKGSVAEQPREDAHAWIWAGRTFAVPLRKPTSQQQTKTRALKALKQLPNPGPLGRDLARKPALAAGATT
jgi:hypothetical protein